MRSFKLLALVLAAPLAVAIVATAAASPPERLQGAKAAAARYHSIAQAEAAGYVPAGPCIASPNGAMGFHWENPALMADDAVDPLRPEILVYAAKAGGGLELVAVEYYKRDADQNLTTDGDRPSIFGRPFDGPMPAHHPGMGVHYDLHVWLYRDNPTGTFSMWNPDVVCP